MLFNVESYPEKGKELLTVNTLDLVYTEGCPLYLAAWIASKYNEELAPCIIETIARSFRDWGEIVSRQRKRGIKKIQTKKDFFILLNILKKRDGWKPLPPKFYAMIMSQLNE